jgi:molybdate transport system substrate-binding protein
MAPVARAAPAQRQSSLTVFAAASLTEAFGDLGAAFAATPEGRPTRFHFAGSQLLARQLEDGAAADVLATADADWMKYVRVRNLLASPPRAFARNRLVVIAPREPNPVVRQLPDLARDGVRTVLAAEGVPAGNYSREVLRRLSAAPGFGADFGDQALRNVVSLEESVKGVVAKVQLGEADAGIVYSSDVTTAVAPHVRRIEIADAYNVVARYYVAVVRGARDPNRAERFVGFLFEQQARQVLKTHGFTVTEEQTGDDAE